jgi:hypothetical protein
MSAVQLVAFMNFSLALVLRIYCLSKQLALVLHKVCLLTHSSYSYKVYYKWQYSIKSTEVTMVNDKAWQRRTDEWVNSIHKSRLKKERELIERNKLLNTKDLAKDDSSSSIDSDDLSPADNKESKK